MELIRRTVCIACALILTLGGWARAQDSLRTREVGIGSGYARQSLVSEVISPLVHSGGAAALQLFFRSGGEKSRHHVQLFYSSFNLKSSANGLSTTSDNFSMQYAYHRRLPVRR